MKKVLYILSLLTIFSCSKSENIVDQIPTKSIAKCKINGVLWEGELKSCGILNNTFVASASKKTSNGTDELLIGIDDVNSLVALSLKMHPSVILHCITRLH
ncbi:MAG: hypothetical protein IPL98_11595 [Saprospiraceae bacterium]|nr:hypothetical protein [Saprospiraceae bacterium]